MKTLFHNMPALSLSEEDAMDTLMGLSATDRKTKESIAHRVRQDYFYTTKELTNIATLKIGYLHEIAGARDLGTSYFSEDLQAHVPTDEGYRCRQLREDFPGFKKLHIFQIMGVIKAYKNKEIKLPDGEYAFLADPVHSKTHVSQLFMETKEVKDGLFAKKRTVNLYLMDPNSFMSWGYAEIIAAT